MPDLRLYELHHLFQLFVLKLCDVPLKLAEKWLCFSGRHALPEKPNIVFILLRVDCLSRQRYNLLILRVVACNHFRRESMECRHFGLDCGRNLLRDVLYEWVLCRLMPRLCQRHDPL